jgi:hypothetical protein
MLLLVKIAWRISSSEDFIDLYFLSSIFRWEIAVHNVGFSYPAVLTRYSIGK